MLNLTTTHGDFGSIKRLLVNSDDHDHTMLVDFAESVGEVSFKEIQDFLKDDTVDREIRKIIASKYDGMADFSSLEDFLCDDTIHIDIRKNLAKRIIPQISFGDVKTFIAENYIDSCLRKIVTQKIGEGVSFQEIKKFLEDGTIDEEIKELVLDKLSSENGLSIDCFMNNPDIDVYVRLSVGKILEPHNYSTISDSGSPRIIMSKIQRILSA